MVYLMSASGGTWSMKRRVAVGSRRRPAALVVALLSLGLLLAALGGPAASAADGASVTFQVESSDGLRVPGIRVAVGDVSGRTGADGRVSFDGLQPGESWVSLRFDGWELFAGSEEAWTWVSDAKVPLDPGADGLLVLSPPDLTVLHGYVRDKGATKGDARVHVVAGDSEEDVRVSTDATGHYIVPVPSGTALTVSVGLPGGHEGYAPSTLRESDAARYRVRSGGTLKVDVTVPPLPTGAVRGKVLIESCIVPEVSAYALDRGDELMTRTTADADGSFALTNLFPATYELTFSCTSGALRQFTRVVRVRQHHVSDLGVVTRAYGSLRVRVVRSGRGVVSSGQATVLDRAGHLVRTKSFRFAKGSTRTHRRVTFRNLPAGRYRVALAGDDVQTGLVRVKTARTVSAGRLRQAPHRARVRVTMKARGGGRAGGAGLFLVDRNDTYLNAETGIHGVAHLDGVAPGTYRLFVDAAMPGVDVRGMSVSRGRGNPVRVTVSPRTRTKRITVRLDRPGTLTGRVVDVDGQGVRGLRVTATTPVPITLDPNSRALLPHRLLQASVSARVKKNGSYRITRLAPGVSYRVTVSDTSAGVYPNTDVGASKRGGSRRFLVRSGQNKKLPTTTLRTD